MLSVLAQLHAHQCQNVDVGIASVMLTDKCAYAPGRMLLTKHLGLQKALIVIDNVSYSGLSYLLPDHGAAWKVHPESIIIATSRNSYTVERRCPSVFEMELLQAEPAAKLFALYAYAAERQPVNLEALEQEMVECCGGLPLTLKVGTH